MERQEKAARSHRVVIENISAAYRENAPEYIYFFALYNIFSEFLDDIPRTSCQ